MIKLGSESKSNKLKKCNTDSSSTILMFTNAGNVIKIPAFVLENINSEGINIASFNDEFKEKDEKILNVISINNFSQNIDVIFFTQKGYVKKTSISEFCGDYSSTLVYRFRGENDSLIDVEFVSSEGDYDIILVTTKAMCIRFKGETVNYMGKVASGVTGISLTEDDYVVHGFVNNNNKELELKSKGKQVKTVPLEEIKVQNRAGRGKNIMLVVLGDYVVDVKLK